MDGWKDDWVPAWFTVPLTALYRIDLNGEFMRARWVDRNGQERAGAYSSVSSFSFLSAVPSGHEMKRRGK